MPPARLPESYAADRRRELAYLGVAGEEERNYSETTARMIDDEVRALIDEAQRRAREILSGRRAALDALGSTGWKRAADEPGGGAWV